MTTPNQNYLYRQFFRLKIHEAYGDTFQQLFSRIMGYHMPGFQAVAPWGNWGDGGNDGWVPSNSHYFQVFGPKPGSFLRELEAVNKSIGDFDKLRAKWGAVKKYTFVMNDRFQGIPAPIGAALKQLKADKGLDDAYALDATNLLSAYMTLDEDMKQDIVGAIPDVELDFVDPRAVGELLSALAEKSGAALTFLSEDAPDFDKKISLNGITAPVRARLVSNSYQAHLVSDFLDVRDDALQQAIAQEIRETYAESKQAISSSLTDCADLRYLWMVDKLIPASVHENPHSLAAYRIAAELVLAKYFETCDAYEHPDNVVTP